MKIPTLITDYSRLSEANIDLKAQTVILSLTGNSSFPETTPTLAELTTLQEAFNQSVTKAASGDRTLIALKNQAKESLLAAMRQLSIDIESQANGDRAKLISSGFDLAADGENVPPLSSPTDFKIMEGINPGEMKFSIRRVPQAVSYIHEYTEEVVTDDSKWISKPSTSREHTFTGLRSGIRIYGRIVAIGRKGQESYSNILTRVMQ